MNRNLACSATSENFFPEVYEHSDGAVGGAENANLGKKEALMVAATVAIATAIGAAIGGKKGATRLDLFSLRSNR
jgi:hypothetical protein